jgi:hypothetical protein
MIKQDGDVLRWAVKADFEKVLFYLIPPGLPEWFLTILSHPIPPFNEKRGLLPALEHPCKIPKGE